MFKRGWIVTLALLIAVGAVAGAQEEREAARVGVVVRVESPGVQIDEPEVLGAIMAQLARGFEQVERVALVDQEALGEAQRKLGVHLDHRAKPDDLKRLARLLRLERIVVVRVTISDRFRVGMATTVYSGRGERLSGGHFHADAPKLDSALEKAVRLWLQQTLPVLS